MSESIRLLLTVPASHKELFAELEKVPERHRAERVRLLATMGIAALNGSAQLVHAVPAQTGTVQAVNELASTASGLNNSLVRQLAESM